MIIYITFDWHYRRTSMVFALANIVIPIRISIYNGSEISIAPWPY